MARLIKMWTPLSNNQLFFLDNFWWNTAPSKTDCTTWQRFNASSSFRFYPSPSETYTWVKPSAVMSVCIMTAQRYYLKSCITCNQRYHLGLCKCNSESRPADCITEDQPGPGDQPRYKFTCEVSWLSQSRHMNAMPSQELIWNRTINYLSKCGGLRTLLFQSHIFLNLVQENALIRMSHSPAVTQVSARAFGIRLWVPWLGCNNRNTE